METLNLASSAHIVPLLSHFILATQLRNSLPVALHRASSKTRSLTPVSKSDSGLFEGKRERGAGDSSAQEGDKVSKGGWPVHLRGLRVDGTRRDPAQGPLETWCDPGSRRDENDEGFICLPPEPGMSPERIYRK